MEQPREIAAQVITHANQAIRVIDYGNTSSKSEAMAMDLMAKAGIILALDRLTEQVKQLVMVQRNRL